MKIIGIVPIHCVQIATNHKPFPFFKRYDTGKNIYWYQLTGEYYEPMPSYYEVETAYQEYIKEHGIDDKKVI